jgi:hypothetical protein
MAVDTPVTFTATLADLDKPMFPAAIRIPAGVADQFRQPKGAIRVLCSINHTAEFPCALNPRGDQYLIIASKALIRKHKLANGHPFTVTIRPDPDNGLLLPEELQEVLEQDTWGKAVFNGLLPGMQRSYIYYVRSAKSMDTRIKRSFEIVEKLKRTHPNPARPQGY